MRHRIAAIAATLVLCASATAARAASITVDFPGYAPYAGTLYDGITTSVPPFDLNTDQVFVVGPAQSSYAGSIGLRPEYSPTFGLNGISITNGGRLDPPLADYVAVNSITVTVAPDTSNVLDMIAAVGAPSNAQVTWDATITGVTTETFTLPPGTTVQAEQAIAYLLAAGADNGAQILSIAVDYTPVVPEPSAAAMGGIGLGAVLLLAFRRRARLTRTSGSCRA